MADIYDWYEWPVPLNVGPLDRAIRVVAGLAILALTVTGPETLWGVAGLLPLITGVAGYCPLYSLLGFSTVGTPHRVRHA